MHDLYLLVEEPDGILVIDQHALHERVLFERFKEQLTSGRLESQGLLVPETVSLPPAQAALVLEQREALAQLGLQVQDFGNGTLLLASYAALLGKRSPHGILRAVADHLTANGRAPQREQLLNDLLALMACHAAVRAGDRLTQEEIDALVAQRHFARDSHHCPHGRPTSLLFTRRDLDRQFRRL
jgi:DNA mismatch repair protein MutL